MCLDPKSLDDLFEAVEPKPGPIDRVKAWFGRWRVRARAVRAYAYWTRNFFFAAKQYVRAAIEHKTTAYWRKAMIDNYREMMNARRRMRTGRV